MSFDYFYVCPKIITRQIDQSEVLRLMKVILCGFAHERHLTKWKTRGMATATKSVVS